LFMMHDRRLLLSGNGRGDEQYEREVFQG
jgi:hypothetical protein